MLTLGAVIAAFAIEEFLVPNTILDGGVIGIGIMINNLTEVSLSILTIVLNVPFLIIGSRQLGKMFMVKSGYSMAVFSVFVEIFKPLENATSETILAVCFGGVILGLGVGIIIKFGGCLDGTETVAIMLNKKKRLAGWKSCSGHESDHIFYCGNALWSGQGDVQSSYILYNIKGA